MRKTENTKKILKLVYSAICLALALVLPFLTMQIPEIGSMLCPMHIPVILCGFICGPVCGLVVGFISPILRFFMFGMPPIMPGGLGMAFELATYGLLAGICYKAFPKKIPYIYVSLVIAMLGGRVIWGIVRFILAKFVLNVEFPMSAFLSGAFATAIPGIIVQIVLIPVLIIALRKAKLIINE